MTNSRRRSAQFTNLAFLLLVAAFAQQIEAKQAPKAQPPDSAQICTLVLGTVASEPGTSVEVPVYYKAAGAINLRKSHVELEFQGNSVTYSGVKKAPFEQAKTLELLVEAKELPASEDGMRRTKLLIDISASGPRLSDSLPDGLWGFLEFKISADATPSAVTLKPQQASGQDSQRKLVRMHAEPGSVIISPPDLPLASCLFFTH